MAIAIWNWYGLMVYTYLTCFRSLFAQTELKWEKWVKISIPAKQCNAVLHNIFYSQWCTIEIRLLLCSFQKMHAKQLFHFSFIFSFILLLIHSIAWFSFHVFGKDCNLTAFQRIETNFVQNCGDGILLLVTWY